MLIRGHSRWHGAALVVLLLPAASAAPALALAAEFSAASVGFAPAYETTLQTRYGAPEVPALRAEIVDSMTAALHAAHGDCRLTLDVVMQRAAPTHPTMKQQLDDPALDPFRTVFYNGGAALTGRVLDVHGQVLETVSHDHFADNRHSISPGKDPWSDARVAIGQFTQKLVSACKRQSGASQAPH